MSQLLTLMISFHSLSREQFEHLTDTHFLSLFLTHFYTHSYSVPFNSLLSLSLSLSTYLTSQLTNIHIFSLFTFFLSHTLTLTLAIVGTLVLSLLHNFTVSVHYSFFPLFLFLSPCHSLCQSLFLLNQALTRCQCFSF